MKKNLGNAFIGTWALVHIIVGVLLPQIEFVIFLMGKYIILAQLLLICGGMLSILGLIINRKLSHKHLSEYLLLMGGFLGITNILGLFAVPLLYDSKIPRKREYRNLLVFPALVLDFSLIMWISLLEDRLHIPFNWFGRNGLTFVETLWDTDVFWGEFWFNLMLISVLIGIILFKFNPNGDNVFRWNLNQTKKIWIGCLSVSIIILVTMGITWKPWFSITNNWFSTQFAYHAVVWPIIIVFCLIFFIPSNIKSRNSSKLINIGIWCSIILFSGIWIYLTIITEFHPHAILSFEMPIYTVIGVGFFLFPLIRFIFSKSSHISIQTGQDIKKSNSNIISMKLKVILLCVLIGCMLGLVALQFYNANQAPIEGSTTMFNFEFPWWWILSHWPNYLFVGTMTCGIVFGIQYFGMKKMVLKTEASNPIGEQTQKLKSNSKKRIREKIIKDSFSNWKVQVGAVFLMMIILGTTTSAAILSEWEERDSPMLLANQVGYYPDSSKALVFQTPGNVTLPNSTLFEIINASSGEIVYSGQMNLSVQKYGYSYMKGQFDTFNIPGEYYARSNVQGKDYQTYPFKIAEDVYDEAIELLYRYFYYQRCNYKVDEVVDGYPGHEACHMDDGDVWNGTEWIYHDLTGGWHDAGDYNKYNSWFQTQWYCAQSLMESYLVDADGKATNVTSLYDSDLPDVIDEALWGMKFLLNCINKEAIQGEEYRYRIWLTVSGYRQENEKEARMSYWGPPEMDWTSPRRVVFDQYNQTFTGSGSGFLFAGTIMEGARMIEKALNDYPNLQWPSWASAELTNVTYLRSLAASVYEKHLSLQNGIDTNVGTFVGKLLYLDELGRVNGGNWTLFDEMVISTLPYINTLNTYPLWFSWSGAYTFGNILSHYIQTNRTAPQEVLNKIDAFQNEQFTLLFDEPFQIKHVQYDGINVLFYGAERFTDVLTSAWLQALMVQLRPETAQANLVQTTIDFLLGINPFGWSLIEGVGDAHVSQYHHRYSYARNPSGAVPGAIPNSLGLMEVSKYYLSNNDLVSEEDQAAVILENFGDHPYFPDYPGNPLVRDGVPSNPNEVWIPYDAMAIRLFTAMN